MEEISLVIPNPVLCIAIRPSDSPVQSISGTSVLDPTQQTHYAIMKSLLRQNDVTFT